MKQRRVREAQVKLDPGRHALSVVVQVLKGQLAKDGPVVWDELEVEYTGEGDTYKVRVMAPWKEAVQ